PRLQHLALQRAGDEHPRPRAPRRVRSDRAGARSEHGVCHAADGDGAVAVAAERSSVRALVSDEDAALLSSLKARRRALAEAANVPAYVIFPDRTLIEMAERRPATLDAMAGITGVGAKKLESYGAIFLEVITGAAEVVHPARMRLVGRPEGQIYDRLAAAQLALARGENGTGKYLSCTHSTLRQIAERQPSTLSELDRIQGMGPLKTERFGAAFLQALRDD
ncbi:MAG: ATP-dependent DNA helicase RecQ, partial [Tabrizicola sp.]|nr:ATP-dependent DNA helicase RecQ [Tabrizicola sp.]